VLLSTSCASEEKGARVNRVPPGRGDQKKLKNRQGGGDGVKAALGTKRRESSSVGDQSCALLGVPTLQKNREKTGTGTEVRLEG